MPKAMVEKKSIDQSSPTQIVYNGLQTAFDFFNGYLFETKLPQCLITMQRHPNSKAYFHGGRFKRAHGEGDFIDEIAMNPMHFEERTPKDILSTLVHEMVHAWQAHFGKVPTRCYHDMQWATKMKQVGLQPSHTGLPGGKEVGQKMTHYIIEDGLFSAGADDYIREHEVLLYQDRIRALEEITAASKAARRKARAIAKDGDEGAEEPAPVKSQGRLKFTCPGCGLIALAKPSALLSCVPCSRALIPAEAAP